MTDQKKTGIWLDTKKAFVVSFLESEKTVDIIESGIEGHERIEGESGPSGKFGDQNVNPERKNEHRKEAEITDYLNQVIALLKESDAIVIFGPAEMKTKLMKQLDGHPDIRHRVRALKTVDSMTKNQVVALVKTHYNL